MALFLFLLDFCFISAILCDETGSSESNRAEYPPLYETIIYNDIADIIKDFENKMNSPLEAFLNTDDSESDENVDDLLSEYQHYLDKAHKQRKNYLEKSKPKNKVPLLQHDRYSKKKPSQLSKYDDVYPSNVNYFNPVPMPRSEFKPLNFLIPINMMKPSFLGNYEPSSFNSKDKLIKRPSFDKMFADEKILQLPPTVPSVIQEPIQSSCYCEPDTFPCECGCKQCLMPVDTTQRKYGDYDKFVPSFMDNPPKDLRTQTDNTLNIKIKVDIQFPKLQEIADLSQNISKEKKLEHGNSISRESSINLPFPYFNFPAPSEMFGFKKPIQDSPSVHKITIHRKKKSKANNGKRHRKKLITFHNIKLEPQHPVLPSLEENYNTSDNHQKSDTNYPEIQPNKTVNIINFTKQLYSNVTSNQTAELASGNDTKTDDNFYLTVNIKNNDNITEDIRRNENSIETDFTRGNLNVSTEEPSLRIKREISNQSISVKKSDVKSELKISNVNENNSLVKKSDKIIIEDNELLYWPNNSKNLSSIKANNITTLIIDTETKKMKLNLSMEAISHNRTRALEQAIFGDVNWDDVGTVAPVFMSFMGKYIRGVLTFCSDSICHSIKCAEKTCIHRICAPIDRLNNKGHCTGSDKTDSIASMEALMDLPSNIALEIVDILQDRMLGKLFGKVTLCIGSKCVSFIASKKSFLKTKCMAKDLNITGHCPNIKNVKIM